MTELDLLLIRQREHQLVAMELRLERARICKQDPIFMREIQLELLAVSSSITDLIKEIESTGIDYFTITAEMARIRAEVRGEE